MSDPLDLDAAAQFAKVQRNGGHTMAADWIDAAVAELRTARARITDLEIRYGDTERHWLKERTERLALAARIAGARSLCDKWESQLLVPVATIRAALSGAIEPAAGAETEKGMDA